MKELWFVLMIYTIGYCLHGTTINVNKEEHLSKMQFQIVIFVNDEHLEKA